MQYFLMNQRQSCDLFWAFFSLSCKNISKNSSLYWPDQESTSWVPTLIKSYVIPQERFQYKVTKLHSLYSKKMHRLPSCYNITGLFLLVFCSSVLNFHFLKHEIFEAFLKHSSVHYCTKEINCLPPAVSDFSLNISFCASNSHHLKVELQAPSEKF